MSNVIRTCKNCGKAPSKEWNENWCEHCLFDGYIPNPANPKTMIPTFKRNQL